MHVFAWKAVLWRLTKYQSMCKVMIHYHERKVLSGIDVSEKAGKISKASNNSANGRISSDIRDHISTDTDYGDINMHRRASAPWQSPQSTRKQKFCQDRSKGKVILEVFFNIQGTVHVEFIPEECTVNKELYVTILRCLRESIRRNRPILGAEQSSAILRNNTPAHRYLLVTDFLAKRKTNVFSHPPYSHDLAP
ncbi:mariner Mos1 transposase [Trichonephila clavipes]|nr:mariner Mos1 transposase [Trichonephila clavipes]